MTIPRRFALDKIEEGKENAPTMSKTRKQVEAEMNAGSTRRERSILKKDENGFLITNPLTCSQMLSHFEPIKGVQLCPCDEPGCKNNTTRRKPFCIDHLEEMVSIDKDGEPAGKRNIKIMHLIGVIPEIVLVKTRKTLEELLEIWNNTPPGQKPKWDGTEEAA